MFLFQQTITAWQKVYVIAGSISLVFAVVWSIFGSAKLQPWNTTAAMTNHDGKQKSVVAIYTRVPEESESDSESDSIALSFT